MLLRSAAGAQLVVWPSSVIRKISADFSRLMTDDMTHSNSRRSDDLHTFSRISPGRPARDPVGDFSQRGAPWRETNYLPPVPTEPRRLLKLVLENYRSG